MPGNSWAQSNNPGWGVYDAQDQEHHNASWLADPRQRSLPDPRYYNDDKIHSSWLHRIHLFRKSLQRKLPSMELLLQSNRVSLTAAPSSSIGTSTPSPDTVRFVLLCGLWYLSSALSSNTGKSILTDFRYPVTLTFVQFGFVAGWCLFFLSPAVHFSSLRRPTKEILKSTFPMGCFQVGGHIFSSMAISRIPVSTVHTIKALSPLFTVAAYALLFGVKYSPKTYFSLLPLTIGVMLACSFDMSASSLIGVICAFGSAIIFVTQNIFFKKIVPSNGGATSHKLDKLNLLLYSSSMAFLLMVPIWMYVDLPEFLASSAHVHHPPHGSESTSSFPTLSIAFHFFLNGTVHFGQNVLAFILLARTSPVTYSIASLVKRVAVICCAIIWFNQRVYGVQGLGIALTFVGLWVYHGAKSDVDQGEKKAGRVAGARDGMLPRTMEDLSDSEQQKVEVSVQVQSSGVPVAGFAYSRPRANSTHPHHHHHIVPSPAVAPAPVPALPSRPQHGGTYSQTHPHAHPNLHIHVATHQHQQPSLESVKERVALSPVDSYPSPPPSVDSPPESPLKEEKQWEVPVSAMVTATAMTTQKGRARRGTITAGLGRPQGVTVAS